MGEKTAIEWTDHTFSGASGLLLKHCPWCGGPWITTGEMWEKPGEDQDDDGEAWKEGAGS